MVFSVVAEIRARFSSSERSCIISGFSPPLPCVSCVVLVSADANEDGSLVVVDEVVADVDGDLDGTRVSLVVDEVVADVDEDIVDGTSVVVVSLRASEDEDVSLVVEDEVVDGTIVSLVVDEVVADVDEDLVDGPIVVEVSL